MSRRWIVALAAAVLAGCGSEPRLSGGTADELHKGVDEVRTAAGAGDREGALRALDQLSERVEREEADGQLAESDAAILRRVIARARRRAEREVVPPQPTAEPAPEATAEPTVEPAPSDDDGEESGEGDMGKGKDKGKGKDEDEGDD